MFSNARQSHEKHIRMMKILVFISFFYFHIGLSQSGQNDHIYWTGKSLVWENFKGKAPSKTKYAALTSSAIDLHIEGQGSQIHFTIRTAFSPIESWKKKQSAELLKHEQLHFDITEYHSRLLRKKLQEIHFKSVKTINKQIQKEFNKISNLAEKMQDRYDKETNHSINITEQEKWNKKVAKLLKETEHLLAPSFTLDLSYLIK